MKSASDVAVVYIDPLPDFNVRELKGVWLYEGTNPFPAAVPAREATALLPVVVGENDEIIFGDRTTKKVILAVYRNRIGAEACELMCETIKEMIDIRRKIARA